MLHSIDEELRIERLIRGQFLGNGQVYKRQLHQQILLSQKNLLMEYLGWLEATFE
jgi:hypothetical protein